MDSVRHNCTIFYCYYTIGYKFVFVIHTHTHTHTTHTHHTHTHTHIHTHTHTHTHTQVLLCGESLRIVWPPSGLQLASPVERMLSNPGRRKYSWKLNAINVYQMLEDLKHRSSQQPVTRSSPVWTLAGMVRAGHGHRNVGKECLTCPSADRELIRV
jgi:hypothetical protein